MAVTSKSFVENATPIIAIIGAIFLAIPSVLLLQQLWNWYKKRRESKRKPELANKENEADMEYEVIEAAERYIQTDPCTNLSDLYLAVSRDIFGDSVESFSEKPIFIAKSVSDSAILDAPPIANFFYKKSLKNFSTVSRLEQIPDVNVSTQTFESDEQLQRSAWLPLEFTGAQDDTQANRAARYQPPVSSNNIICPRRPSRDRIGRVDPCVCQENKQKGGNSTHSVCTIV